MSTAQASGLLTQWERARQVVVIPMSGVQFVSFRQKPAIGTRDLGSCSVVVIMSKYGAILGPYSTIATTAVDRSACWR